MAFVCPTEGQAMATEMGVEKIGRGVDRYFTWEVQKLGTSPAISDNIACLG